jgi:acetyl esterase/lipase
VIQFRTKTVDRMNRNYAGPALAEPFAFPGGHDLVGVPPAFIMDADHDTLRASGQALRAELERAGIEVRYRVLNGSTHGFLQRPGTAPFEEFVATAATWLLQ